MQKISKPLVLGVVGVLGLTLAGCFHSSEAENTACQLPSSPVVSSGTDTLQLAKQGIFSAGGVVVQATGTYDPVNGQYAPEGQLNYADHANVFYQVPTQAKEHAMVFLHGYGQSRMGWMTTPDGREGWSDIFLKKGYPVYLVDQPRRGEAGKTTVSTSLNATPGDLGWYTQFRMGRWPALNTGSQFPKGEEAMEAFFRQMVPTNEGEFDPKVITDALVKVFEKSGKGILLSHSQGGRPAWDIMAQSDNVKAHVAIEPGGFAFPTDLEDSYGVTYKASEMSPEDFQKLIKKPIIVYMGDYIPAEPTSDLNAENFWNSVLKAGEQFCQVVNDRGGDCTMAHLPALGIQGNSHFLFQELNNKEIADHLAQWMAQRGLN